MADERKLKTIKDPISDEDMERLAQIMLDYPSLKKLSKTEFAITALKPAVMWMIANEAVNINKVEKATFGDVLEGLSKQIPSVCKIITWAILNDKERIEKDFEKVYDTLYWECDVKEWAELLFEILNLISVDTFFLLTELTQTFRQMSLDRKMTRGERKQSSQEQATGKCLIL